MVMVGIQPMLSDILKRLLGIEPDIVVVATLAEDASAEEIACFTPHVVVTGNANGRLSASFESLLRLLPNLHVVPVAQGQVGPRGLVEAIRRGVE